MKTLCKSLLIASLAVIAIVIVGSAGAADVSYDKDGQYYTAIY